MKHLISLALAVNSFKLGAQPTPATARAAAIEATKNAIQAECDVAAGGDWQLWFDNLKAYRTVIKPMVGYAIDNPWKSKPNPKNTYAIMRWPSDPNQYVHANTAIPLGYVEDQDPAHWVKRMPLLSIAQFVQSGGTIPLPFLDDNDPIHWAKQIPMIRIAVMMKSWLAERGIDLILVPVPVKAEIYGDKLVADQTLVPADKNVIPHIRRRYLEFLNAGIELVDLYPLFMKERQQLDLFMAADTHWMQKSQRIAAEQIAARLQRYPWVQAAQKAPLRYAETIEKDRPTVAMFWDYLTTEEQTALMPYRIETIKKLVAKGGGEAVVESPNSPVLLAGDSYITYDYPLQAGIVGLLAQQINQPVSIQRVAGALDGIFRDMFRDPAILKGKKVVIWLLNDEPVGRGDMWPKNFALPKRPAVTK